MKTLLASVAAVAALTAVAAPAAAQPYGARHDRGYDDAGSVNGRQAMIERQIERGVRTGQLTGREAARLQDEFRDIQRLEARYRWNGLSRAEAIDLDRRLDDLQVNVRMARRDDDRRRYGYNEYYPPY